MQACLTSSLQHSLVGQRGDGARDLAHLDIAPKHDVRPRPRNVENLVGNLGQVDHDAVSNVLQLVAHGNVGGGLERVGRRWVEGGHTTSRHAWKLMWALVTRFEVLGKLRSFSGLHASADRAMRTPTPPAFTPSPHSSPPTHLEAAERCIQHGLMHHVVHDAAHGVDRGSPHEAKHGGVKQVTACSWKGGGTKIMT